MSDPLREQLLALLRGGQAHLEVDAAVRDFPASLAGGRAGAIPYTPWRLLEHLRIAQEDILEFCRNPEHVSPEWPEGYWPPEDAPPDEGAWQASVEAFCRDLAAVPELVADPRTDLMARIPHGDGQTVLREALLVADHNAYHLGQLLALRKGLGAG
jgi:uncharacterized damage-inducible protein DinB